MASEVLHKQRGFTTVEVVVATILTGALIIPFSIVAIFFLSSMFDRSTESILTSEAQNALRTISEELKSANKILSTNTITDPNRTSGWSTNLAGGILVFDSFALDNNRQIMINSTDGTPHLNESVYFRQGTTLYKRSLPAHESPGNRTVRSCPPNAVVSSCVADTVLTNHLSSLSFTLYDSTNTVTTTPSAATSVLVKIELSKPSLKSPITVEKNIRVTTRKTDL